MSEKEPADGVGGAATAMAMNEIRQQARRTAAERVARLRQQRADQVRKQEELSAAVMTALVERDAIVADAELRAATALAALVSSGLSLTQAARWCDLSDRDAARLVKLVRPAANGSGGSATEETVSGDR